MKRFEPNEQRQADLRSLRDFVVKARDGDRFAWMDIERATGVRMDRRGRDLFRLARQRERRECLKHPGLGVEFSSPSNGIEIVQAGARAIISAVGRGQRSAEHIAGRHLEAMTQEDRNRLLQQQAVLATLSLSRSLAAPPKKLGP